MIWNTSLFRDVQGPAGALRAAAKPNPVQRGRRRRCELKLAGGASRGHDKRNGLVVVEVDEAVSWYGFLEAELEE